MTYFYIVVLILIFYFTNDQVDSNNWDNLRDYYRRKRNEMKKNKMKKKIK